MNGSPVSLAVRASMGNKTSGLERGTRSHAAIKGKTYATLSKKGQGEALPDIKVRADPGRSAVDSDGTWLEDFPGWTVEKLRNNIKPLPHGTGAQGQISKTNPLIPSLVEAGHIPRDAENQAVVAVAYSKYNPLVDDVEKEEMGKSTPNDMTNFRLEFVRAFGDKSARPRSVPTWNADAELVDENHPDSMPDGFKEMRMAQPFTISGSLQVWHSARVAASQLTQTDLDELGLEVADGADDDDIFAGDVFSDDDAEDADDDDDDDYADL